MLAFIYFFLNNYIFHPIRNDQAFTSCSSLFIQLHHCRINFLKRIQKIIYSECNYTYYNSVLTYKTINNKYIVKRKRLGLIWGSRDDTHADIEKFMYYSLFII